MAAPVSLAAVDSKGAATAVQTGQGRWTVLNYWATWCGPCRIEMPELSALAQRHPDIEVVGVTYEALAPGALKAFEAKTPTSYRLVNVQEATLPKALSPRVLGVKALPMTYIIRPDGRVAKRIVAATTAQVIEAVIDRK